MSYMSVSHVHGKMRKVAGGAMGALLLDWIAEITRDAYAEWKDMLKNQSFGPENPGRWPGEFVFIDFARAKRMTQLNGVELQLAITMLEGRGVVKFAWVDDDDCYDNWGDCTHAWVRMILSRIQELETWPVVE